MSKTRTTIDGATCTTSGGEGCEKGDEVGSGTVLKEGEDDGKVEEGISV